jgi:CBS domain-containing protein/sporulation protein YlmC with PRC-barrel domain
MKTPQSKPVKKASPVAKGLAAANKIVAPISPRVGVKALERKNIRTALVSFASLVGRPVKNEDGSVIGKLVDVVVQHGAETYPPVSGLIVKVGQSRAFIDGARITKLSPKEIVLQAKSINLGDFQRRPGESLLDADVLDHQIVDVDGLRVVRTADLYLAPLDKEVRVVGVDTSFRSFVRRIFPNFISRRPNPESVVDWGKVASLADSSGVVRSSESRGALSKLRPADIADLIEDLQGREQGALIEMLDPKLAADALEEMEEDELQGLMRGLPTERAAELISNMEPDEGAEVLRDLDADHRESILGEMDTKVSKDLRQLVSFDETLAGGIMTTHILTATENQSVADALKLIVENRERDVSDGIVIIDDKGKLVDHIHLVELISAKPSALLATLIGPPYPTAVSISSKLPEVLEEFANNRGSSIVVIDDKNKPVGRILADDLVDALSTDKGDDSRIAQGTGAL